MRLRDWESRFTAYVCRIATAPFGWGVHDCALFAAGGVDAVTGEDPAARWRDQYSSEMGGLLQLRRAGFDSHIELAASLYPEIHPSAAWPADIAVIPEGGIGALGLVQGEMVYVLREEGLGLVPIGSAVQILGVR